MKFPFGGLREPSELEIDYDGSLLLSRHRRSAVAERSIRAHLSQCYGCSMKAVNRVSEEKPVEAKFLGLDELNPDVLCNLSHELRSPLTAMRGIVGSLLQKDVEFKEETCRELLGGVFEEICRLEGLVTNLLDMSKLEANIWQPEKQICGVYDLIGETVERFKWTHRGHLFEVKLPLDLPEIVADAGQIRQVLINLLDNATAYSEKGTRVTIAAVNAGKEVVFFVADMGTGIDNNEQDRIFSKYFRGSQQRHRQGGIGLGLTICKTIVEGHGGRIWVKSEPGKGSTFYFSLPIPPVGA